MPLPLEMVTPSMTLEDCAPTKVPLDHTKSRMPPLETDTPEMTPPDRTDKVPPLLTTVPISTPPELTISEAPLLTT